MYSLTSPVIGGIFCVFHKSAHTDEGNIITLQAISSKVITIVAINPIKRITSSTESELQSFQLRPGFWDVGVIESFEKFLFAKHSCL